MFERFTERARKVVVHAQEEARRFNHNYIGTEHLLLGLLREEEGVAARALGSLSVSLDEVREQVESIVGYGEEGTGGQAPYTPRTKKVFELALREALHLGHNYIETEHILLGLARESEGVAARVLSNLRVDPDKVRREVVRMLGGGRSQRGQDSSERGPEDHPSDEALTPQEARTGPVRIVIADDQEAVRDGIKLMLSGEQDLQVVGEAADGGEALELCRRLRPELVLMDVRMPQMDGLAATREIKQRFPEISVMILTMHDNEDYLLEAIRAGAAGYVLKDAPQSELAAAIRKVLEGEVILNGGLSTRLLQRLADEVTRRHAPQPLQPLTSREIEVLKRLALGKTNPEIAQDLIISVGTVKEHVERIMTKLGVSDRTQAVVRAMEVGLVPSDYRRATSGKTIEEWVGQRVNVAVTNLGNGEPGRFECTLEGVDDRGIVLSYEENAKKITRFYPWPSIVFITLGRRRWHRDY